MAPRVLTGVLLIVLATTVYSQTFQYSRGWTNGKRDGSWSADTMDKRGSVLEKILQDPCQLAKLKHVLQGRPITEKFLMPCSYKLEEFGYEDQKISSSNDKHEPFLDPFL